ncbi:hypothetical protein JXA70_17935 [candidate division KSB1 bacterium]|nr:hypothetical protein [candidate division KSB1 bacterium]
MNNVTNILLTGGLHCGKSSLVREIVAALSLPVQGLFCAPEYRREQVAGYSLHLSNGQDLGSFAHIDFFTNRQFDKFGFCESPFLLGADYIRKSIREMARLFIIDEIGVMEQHVRDYSKALEELLDADITALIVVQYRAIWFWQKIKARNDGIIFRLNEDHSFVRTQIMKRLVKIVQKE